MVTKKLQKYLKKLKNMNKNENILTEMSKMQISYILYFLAHDLQKYLEIVQMIKQSYIIVKI